MTTNEVDLRPAPKLRKNARLWQAYLAWYGQMEQRKRHTLRMKAAERGKSNLDPVFEQELMDMLKLDVLVKPKNKAEREVSLWQIMINYGEAVGPIWDWCLSQRGLGESLTAQLLAQINDVGQFATVSKLWRHSGYGIFPYWLDEKDRVQAPRLGYKWLERKEVAVKVLTAMVGQEEMGEAMFWLGEYGGQAIDTAVGLGLYTESIETVFALFPYLKLRHVGKTMGRVVARCGQDIEPGLLRAATVAAIERNRRNNENVVGWAEAVEEVEASHFGEAEDIGPDALRKEVVERLRLESTEVKWAESVAYVAARLDRLPPQPVIPLRVEVAESHWRLSRHRDVKLRGYHSPFNGDLKATLFNVADQFIRHQSSPWVDLYYAEKTRQRALHPEKEKVLGRWHFNDGHLHARARRKMIKEFLKELWGEWSR